MQLEISTELHISYLPPAARKFKYFQNLKKKKKKKVMDS